MGADRAYALESSQSLLQKDLLVYINQTIIDHVKDLSEPLDDSIMQSLLSNC